MGKIVFIIVYDMHGSFELRRLNVTKPLWLFNAKAAMANHSRLKPIDSQRNKRDLQILMSN